MPAFKVAETSCKEILGTSINDVTPYLLLVILEVGLRFMLVLVLVLVLLLVWIDLRWNILLIDRGGSIVRSYMRLGID